MTAEGDQAKSCIPPRQRKQMESFGVAPLRAAISSSEMSLFQCQSNGKQAYCSTNAHTFLEVISLKTFEINRYQL